MIGFDSAFESLFGNQYALLEIAKQKLGVSDDDIRRLTLRWKQQHDQLADLRRELADLRK